MNWQRMNVKATDLSARIWKMQNKWCRRNSLLNTTWLLKRCSKSRRLTVSTRSSKSHPTAIWHNRIVCTHNLTCPVSDKYIKRYNWTLTETESWYVLARKMQPTSQRWFFYHIFHKQWQCRTYAFGLVLDVKKCPTCFYPNLQYRIRISERFDKFADVFLKSVNCKLVMLSAMVGRKNERKELWKLSAMVPILQGALGEIS